MPAQWQRLPMQRPCFQRSDAGAQSGLGPRPGWGPVRVGAHILAHMGSYGPIYGPIWALMGPPGQVLEDYVNFP